MMRMTWRRPPGQWDLDVLPIETKRKKTKRNYDTSMYIPLETILNNENRIRNLNEQISNWLKSCDFFQKEKKKRKKQTVKDWEKLDDPRNNRILLHGHRPLRLYAKDFFSLLIAFVRWVISVFSWDTIFSNLSTLSNTSTRCVCGSYLTSKGRLMVDT